MIRILSFLHYITPRGDGGIFFNLVSRAFKSREDFAYLTGENSYGGCVISRKGKGDKKMAMTKEEVLYRLLVEKGYRQPILKDSISVSDALDQLITVDSFIRDGIFQDGAILAELLNGASIVEKIVIQEILSLRERVSQLEAVVDKRWYKRCQELLTDIQKQKGEIASLKSELRSEMQISDEQLQTIKEVLDMSVPDCLAKFVPYPNWNVRVADRFRNTTVRELLRYRNKKQLITRNFGKLSVAALENMLKYVSGAIGFEFKLGMDLSFLD